MFLQHIFASLNFPPSGWSKAEEQYWCLQLRHQDEDGDDGDDDDDDGDDDVGGDLENWVNIFVYYSDNNIYFSAEGKRGKSFTGENISHRLARLRNTRLDHSSKKPDGNDDDDGDEDDVADYHDFTQIGQAAK